MKKLAYVIAAVSAIAMAVPSIANAETIVIKKGHHGMGMGMHRDHWHPHHDHMMMGRHRHHG
jgi:hypothetical protein